MARKAAPVTSAVVDLIFPSLPDDTMRSAAPRCGAVGGTIVELDPDICMKRNDNPFYAYSKGIDYFIGTIVCAIGAEGDEGGIGLGKVRR